jgi:outer membrane protein assembly factor BamD
MPMQLRPAKAGSNRIPATCFAAVLAASGLLLSACSNGDEEVVYVEQPVTTLYNDAMDELMAESYQPAAEMFDEVERQHPYSAWATKGQLMAAFAYYKKSSYPEAVVTLDRFIQLHPAHAHVDYAYYLKALCYYERITDVARDQKTTERARDGFEEVMTRFPDTSYAADAGRKLVLIRDQLAGKEMAIGRYYQKRGHYLAAINRFRTVVDDYETTSHAPEALHRLTELYLALGVTDEAQRTAAVLGYNYPGSEWYQDSYALLTQGPSPVVRGGSGETERSFFARAWDWIF